MFQRGKLLSPTKARCVPRLRPAVSADALLRVAQGVLLYGPPGTGKTMIAKALAKESGACFLNVRSAALQSKWFGDAQKLVTAVFTLAWKIQPCVIFIDEIDSFLGTRKSNEHEAVTSMKTEFMALWDGFLTDNNARVLVLAATNRPWDIDEAILRRLPRAFEVPLPDAQQRQRILSVLLRGEDVDETLWADRDGALEQLAKASEGYSGSDLQDLCKQAAMLPIHDLLEEERLERAQAGEGALLPQREPRALSAEDLFAVLEVRPRPQRLTRVWHIALTESLFAAERSATLGRGCGRLPPQRDAQPKPAQRRAAAQGQRTPRRPSPRRRRRRRGPVRPPGGADEQHEPGGCARGWGHSKRQRPHAGCCRPQAATTRAWAGCGPSTQLARCARGVIVERSESV